MHYSAPTNFLILLFLIISCSSSEQEQSVESNVESQDQDRVDGFEKLVRSGEIWKDTEGNPINAHGGGVLHHEGKYYWFGEIKKGKTWLPEVNIRWDGYRVDAGGVSCYSSENLTDWKYEGVALAPVETDSTHDLHPSGVIERPKVIYNDKTGKFVMWLHVDSEDYSYARSGVAISEQPEGPYEYITSYPPDGDGKTARDQTLFQDDDGKAYHIYASEGNATLYVRELTDDYLKPTGKYKRIMAGKSREAPAVFKRKNKYYLVSSGCTGWDPNPAEYAMADSIFGEWTVMGNPCKGEGIEVTFRSQSTFVLPVEGKEDAYIFMADRWNKKDLPDSRYVWLPITFKGDSMIIRAGA